MKQLPNILTILRILAIPVILLLMLWNPASLAAAWWAFGLYVGASLTDWLDGYLARRWQVVSAFGRFLDPIADKMLIIAVLFSLVANGAVTGWGLVAALVIVMREIIIAGLREFLGGQAIVVPVTQIAKWKTAVQMVAIGLLIIAPFTGQAWMMAGTWLLYIAAAMTAWSGGDYLIRGFRAIAQMDRGPEKSL